MCCCWCGTGTYGMKLVQVDAWHAAAWIPNPVCCPTPHPTTAGALRGARHQGAAVPGHARGHLPCSGGRRQQPLGQHLAQVGTLRWLDCCSWISCTAAHSPAPCSAPPLTPPCPLPPPLTPALRGELYTWGLASSGELGHGGWTPIEVNIPRMITSLQRTRIVSVACGANHTLAISEIGQLWSCGRGRHGQVCGRAGQSSWQGLGAISSCAALHTLPAARFYGIRLPLPTCPLLLLPCAAGPRPLPR